MIIGLSAHFFIFLNYKMCYNMMCTGIKKNKGVQIFYIYADK